MTQFTDSFYRAYYKAKAELAQAEEAWDSELAHPAQALKLNLINLHEQQVQALKLLVKLENLWGVYCVQYTADAKTSSDRTWVEAECLKELSIILEN